MAEKRLIDADEARRRIIAFATGLHSEVLPVDTVMMLLMQIPPVDAVEVVRCKECRFAKPYERMDGKTGYYCQFCGHSFKYGTNCERLYNPIKESDDFCSYGERKDCGGNG